MSHSLKCTHWGFLKLRTDFKLNSEWSAAHHTSLAILAQSHVSVRTKICGAVILTNTFMNSRFARKLLTQKTKPMTVLKFKGGNYFIRNIRSVQTGSVNSRVSIRILGDRDNTFTGVTLTLLS